MMFYEYVFFYNFAVFNGKDRSFHFGVPNENEKNRTERIVNSEHFVNTKRRAQVNAR